LLASVPGIISAGAMLQPTFAHGFGPFPDMRGRWINMPDDWHARRAGACLYAALVADVSLDLIGAKDTILVEGRFGEAEVFVRALASLRPNDQIYCSDAHTDVSFGALRLIDETLKPSGSLRQIKPLDSDLSEYKLDWLRQSEAVTASV